MIEEAFHYCPQCSKPLEAKMLDGHNHQVCSNGHVLYKNQNVCVSGVIVENGKMLLTRRAYDPQKGKLDFVGGFVEPDERPEDGMLRELKEELGVEGEIIKLLGVYGPDLYEFKGVHNYNIGVTYQVRIVSGNPKANDDVASLEWVDLNILPYGEMSFPSQNQFLEALRDKRVELQ